MSTVSFFSINKTVVVKLIAVVILSASILFYVFFRKDNPENPEVLGKTTSQPSSTPTPKPKESLLKSAEEKLSDFLDTSVHKTKKLTDNMLDETSRIIQNTASKSAESVTNVVSKTVSKNIVEVLVKQIEKLPAQEKTELQRQFCK